MKNNEVKSFPLAWRKYINWTSLVDEAIGNGWMVEIRPVYTEKHEDDRVEVKYKTGGKE